MGGATCTRVTKGTYGGAKRPPMQPQVSRPQASAPGRHPVPGARRHSDRRKDPLPAARTRVAARCRSRRRAIRLGVAPGWTLALAPAGHEISASEADLVRHRSTSRTAHQAVAHHPCRRTAHDPIFTAGRAGHRALQTRCGATRCLPSDGRPTGWQCRSGEVERTMAVRTHQRDRLSRSNATDGPVHERSPEGRWQRCGLEALSRPHRLHADGRWQPCA